MYRAHPAERVLAPPRSRPVEGYDHRSTGKASARLQPGRSARIMERIPATPLWGGSPSEESSHERIRWTHLCGPTRRQRRRRAAHWGEILAGSPQADGPLWLHLDYSAPRVRSWLLEESGLDPVVAEALLSGETRPRVVPGADGLLVILRGVNLNPGAARRHGLGPTLDRELQGDQPAAPPPDGGRGHRRRSLAGPARPTRASLLVELCDRLLVRMGGVLEDLDDEVDALEEGAPR